MKTTKNITVLLLLTALIGVASAVNIGAGPSTINFPNMIKGGYAEQVITVSTSGNEDLSCTVEAIGDGKDWLTFSPGTKFILKANSRYNLLAIMQPPADAMEGVYRTRIQIKAAPTTESGEGAGMAVGAGVSINVITNVTSEQISRYNITGVSVKNAEIDYPIEFTFNIQNTGNVRTKPQLRIDIINDEGKNAGTVLYNESEILPSREKIIIVNAPSKGLKIGAYTAVVGYYADEKLIHYENLTFDILEAGSVTAKGELMTLMVDKTQAKIDDTIKITGLFKNNGDVAVNAKLKGEILNDAGGLEASFESDELRVEPGKTENLIVYHTPKHNGKFTLKAKALYSKKTTNERQTQLTVGGANYLLYGGIAIAIAAIVAAAYYLKNKKEEQKQ